MQLTTRRKARGLKASLVLICILTAFAPLSVADYRQFVFTAEKPYYFKGGKVDFGTYNGFRRYHSDCHVCHGPAGLGSSYAPALVESLKTLSWPDFADSVIRGRQGMNNRIMPSFAGNNNVLPYLSDIYAYLKARSDGIIGIARPKRFPKVKKP